MPRRGRRSPPRATLADRALVRPSRTSLPLPAPSACAFPVHAAQLRPRACAPAPYVSGARRTWRRLTVRVGRHDLRAGELHQPYPPPGSRHGAGGHRTRLLSGVLTLGLAGQRGSGAWARPYWRRLYGRLAWQAGGYSENRVPCSAVELSFARDQPDSRWACSLKGL